MTVRIEWNQRRVMDEIGGELNIDLREIAQKIHRDAKSTSAFSDKTGKLRASVKWHESKFPDGGFIVIADAPHAHLIEFGHGGKRPAPAHPFLRPAKDKNIQEARRITGAR